MMSLERVNELGLLLLGCGKMGSAMLQGWLAQGVSPKAVTIIDPYPNDWVQSLVSDGVGLNTEVTEAPAVCVLAVKPQMMSEALPSLQAFGNKQTLMISIAAGTSLRVLQAVLGEQTPIIRAMPNTPAAIGKGITAFVGNGNASEIDMQLAEKLLGAVGQTIRVANEDEIDAVTGVSGSGPAYVFHLIETLAEAGKAQGLSSEVSMQLAKATVAGAAALAEGSEEDVSQLRVNVTSPKGTTEAALKVLMDENNGFPALMKSAVSASVKRAQELGQ